MTMILNLVILLNQMMGFAPSPAPSAQAASYVRKCPCDIGLKQW